MDWQAFIFDPDTDWIGRLDKRARKRFGDENIADEAMNFALKRLSENDWAKLHAYKQRSKPGTYLLVVFNNHLEDFARKKFGYPRPPAWVERLGEHWKIIWRRLCLEREESQSLLTVYEHIKDQTQDIIRTIKARISDCGKHSNITSVGGSRNDNHEEQYTQQEAAENNLNNENNALAIDEEIDIQQSQDILAALCDVLDFQADKVALEMQANKMAENAERFAEDIQLSDQQQLLLKLVYQQGYSLSAAARLMELPDHQARRALKTAEADIAEVLASMGLSLENFVIA